MIRELVIAVYRSGDGRNMFRSKGINVFSEHIDGITKSEIEWGIGAFHNVSRYQR
ncbi:hypothetical protein HLBS07_32080 [Vibrio alginolyticus]|nr:hypothetical protein HLBS07_32080 [Vibrio alginolyticus]